MISDIWTIVWKEWRELLLARGTLRGSLARLGIMVAVFGVFLPLQTGRAWVESPGTLAYWAWVPLFLVVGVVADSFAGERERHTLETLLASRMPDRPILFGKVLAAIGYGWGIAVASLLLGLVTVNVAHGQGQLLVYPALVLVGGLALGLLGSGLMACAGVLISLRAPTVRQAAQTMSIATFAVFWLPILALQVLQRMIPAERVAWLLAALQRADWAVVLAVVMAILAAADLVLLWAAMARFQRARLILD